MYMATENRQQKMSKGAVGCSLNHQNYGPGAHLPSQILASGSLGMTLQFPTTAPILYHAQFPELVPSFPSSTLLLPGEACDPINGVHSNSMLAREHSAEEFTQGAWEKNSSCLLHRQIQPPEKTVQEALASAFHYLLPALMLLSSRQVKAHRPLVGNPAHFHHGADPSKERSRHDNMPFMCSMYSACTILEPPGLRCYPRAIVS